MKKFIIAVAASMVLLASANAQVDMNSTQMQSIEGRVGNFLEPGLFWVQETNGVKVLVYSTGEATKNLRVGQKVRVTGSAPSDWSRLADQELNAKQIQEL
jgi:predicted RNA-binding protein (virulence factor B family)